MEANSTTKSSLFSIEWWKNREKGKWKGKVKGERRMFPRQRGIIAAWKYTNRDNKRPRSQRWTGKRIARTTRMGNIGYTAQFSSRIRSSGLRPRRENCLRKEFRCRWRSWSNFVDETRAILPYARARNSICFPAWRRREEKGREEERAERSIDVKV